MTEEELGGIKERHSRGVATAADVDSLLAEIERLTTCDFCGSARSLGLCEGYCDCDD